MPVFNSGSRGGTEVVSDRLLTIPNVLSLVRLAALPLIFFDVVSGREGRALVVLVIVSWSDWIDGYVARRFNQVSRIGRLLDP
ncbi:MAG: CDP-alcohol phosphatidyltransferase family protein, partial [Actinomycetota bacterium]|nr:CDP-alcohol phosphatidyltransferase family protein [Actinomycetota bacterium]